jgi:hypothetical protein
MNRLARGIVAVLAIATLGSAAGVAWLALGPAITKACALPSLQPAPGWVRTEERRGSINGPGDIWGSSVVWRSADGARTLEVAALQNGWEGDIPNTTAIVRGVQARVFERSSADKAQAGFDVFWNEGLLGCTVMDATLLGPGVTREDAAAVANELH